MNGYYLCQDIKQWAIHSQQQHKFDRPHKLSAPTRTQTLLISMKSKRIMRKPVTKVLLEIRKYTRQVLTTTIMRVFMLMVHLEIDCLVYIYIYDKDTYKINYN